MWLWKYWWRKGIRINWNERDNVLVWDQESKLACELSRSDKEETHTTIRKIQLPHNYGFHINIKEVKMIKNCLNVNVHSLLKNWNAYSTFIYVYKIFELELKECCFFLMLISVKPDYPVTRIKCVLHGHKLRSFKRRSKFFHTFFGICGHLP